MIHDKKVKVLTTTKMIIHESFPKGRLTFFPFRDRTLRYEKVRQFAWSHKMSHRLKKDKSKLNLTEIYSILVRLYHEYEGTPDAGIRTLC